MRYLVHVKRAFSELMETCPRPWSILDRRVAGEYLKSIFFSHSPLYLEWTLSRPDATRSKDRAIDRKRLGGGVFLLCSRSAIGARKFTPRHNRRVPTNGRHIWQLLRLVTLTPHRHTASLLPKRRPYKSTHTHDNNVHNRE